MGEEKTLRKIGLKKITYGYNSFTRGINNSVISFEFDGKSLNILPLICYEIIFPNLIENKKKHFNFIINISEDAWFGNSIGPEQHFVKAIFRSANKGISAFISPQGEILKTLKSTETGNIEMDLPILKSKNINKNKNLIFALLLIAYVITFIILKKFKL